MHTQPHPLREWGRTAADFHARATRSVAAFRSCTDRGGGALGCTLTPAFRTWEGGGARLAYGAYGPVVALWQAALRPGHLLVLRTEDLDTPAPYRAAATFLWGAAAAGASAAATDPQWRALLGGAHANVGRRHQRVGAMWPATRQLLTTFYADLNAGLCALTGDPTLVWPTAGEEGGKGGGTPPPPPPPPPPTAQRH